MQPKDRAMNSPVLCPCVGVGVGAGVFSEESRGKGFDWVPTCKPILVARGWGRLPELGIMPTSGALSGGSSYSKQTPKNIKTSHSLWNSGQEASPDH